jgi:hypothetical protein
MQRCSCELGDAIGRLALNCLVLSKEYEAMEPIIPDQQALRLVVRQDLSDAEKYRLAQADTLMRLIKADSIEEAERMLSDASIQQLVQEHNQKMRGAR